MLCTSLSYRRNFPIAEVVEGELRNFRIFRTILLGLTMRELFTFVRPCVYSLKKQPLMKQNLLCMLPRVCVYFAYKEIPERCMICFILLILAKKPGKDGSQTNEDSEAEKKSKISKLEEVLDVFSNRKCYNFYKIDALDFYLILNLLSYLVS